MLYITSSATYFNSFDSVGSLYRSRRGYEVVAEHSHRKEMHRLKFQSKNSIRKLDFKNMDAGQRENERQPLSRTVY